MLDAHGLLLFLQREGPYEAIKKHFKNAQTNGESVLINEMSVGEIYHVTARRHSLERAEAFLPLLEVLPLRVVANGMEDILRAARIKAKYAIGYTNALVVATAEKENAILVTGDPEFRVVDEIVAIEWLTEIGQDTVSGGGWDSLSMP